MTSDERRKYMDAAVELTEYINHDREELMASDLVQLLEVIVSAILVEKIERSR